MGLEPDGDSTGKQEQVKPVLTTEIADVSEDWTLAEAAKTRAFWAILICVGIPAMVNTGITFHMISIFNANGLSMQLAATILGMMAFVGIPMSFVSGFITEKVKTNYLLAAVFVIQFAYLLSLIVTNNVFLAILFGLIWGISGGLERIALNIIWPNYFGRAQTGSISGVRTTVAVLGSSFRPLPFGIGFDLFHSYTPVLLFSLIFPVIGVLCALLAKKPQKACE